MEIRLKELSERLCVTVHGEGNPLLTHVASLTAADPEGLSFLGDPKYRGDLERTRAGAVILTANDAAASPVPGLISDNPYLTFARAAAILHPRAEVVGGVHPSAIVDPTATIDPSAYIGPLAVVEAEAQIGPRVFVGPGCIIGREVSIGEDSRLVARVTLCAGTQVGKRALLHPGAVIGGDGFGFARDGVRWLRIPQVGRAVLGDDVDIGANTCVDRGTIGDTRIGDGVKLDNLIQIGHNVEIGENTAMAGNAGVAGSTRIGRNCTIGGAAAIGGHLCIGDDVHFTGMTMVTHSFSGPGSYSSGIPAMASSAWRRSVARFRRLDELTRRVKDLEASIATMKEELGRGDS